ncbi:MAG: hypothetical protein P4L86_21470 [Mycobacterium sp.]|nr:hypothetical protein [Mycobacterium sp.]
MNDAATTVETGMIKRRRSLLVKTFGFAGIAAGVTLGAFGAANTPAPTVVPNASNGHASPAATVYSSPRVGDMNMGATATFTTPSAAEATSVAVPPVKAPHR